MQAHEAYLGAYQRSSLVQLSRAPSVAVAALRQACRTEFQRPHLKPRPQSANVSDSEEAMAIYLKIDLLGGRKIVQENMHCACLGLM